MVKTNEISLEKRCMIISQHKMNISARQIGRNLNLWNTTVSAIIKKYNDTGIIKNKERAGRPRKTTGTEDRRIIITSKRNRRLTAPEIASHINHARERGISVTTVKDRLHKAGLFGRIAARKPLLRPKNKKIRLEWAREHQNWSSEDWCQVLWSDESKFEVFGSRRRVFVRRSTGERFSDQCIIPTMKHGGGSVMIWGCFGGQSLGDLIKIEGKLFKEGYKNILQSNAIPSGLRIIGNNFTFQQDNDPKHKAKLCQEYLKKMEKKNIIKIMIWPPQSPDLNPIELLWDELDRSVRKSCPNTQNDLWKKLQKEWVKIKPDTLRKLLERMPRLCQMIIEKQGGYIDEA